MLLHRICLRGFKGVNYGLGVDEIDLDLSELGGLVALAGQNGKGKTTILENMHPFRQLVSRAGTLASHCYLKDSHKILQFEMGGDTYQTVVLINAASGKQEGHIYKNGSSESLTTGKVKEYDQVVTDLFGSPTLFFASIFCAQGSRKLSEFKPAELKSLFSEFLGLDRLVAYEETAKRVVSALSLRATALDARSKELTAEAFNFGAVASGIEAARAEIAECETRIASNLEEEGRLEAAIADATAAIAASGADRILVENLQRQVHDARQSAQTRIDAIRSQHKELSTDLEKLEAWRKELSRDKRRAETARESEERLAIVETRIKALNEKHIALLDQDQAAGDLIDQARNALQAARDDHAQDVKQMSDRVAEIHGRTMEVDAAIDKARAMAEKIENDPDVARLESVIAQHELNLKDLDLRDPACESTTCSYIVRAIESRDLLPELRKNLEALAERNASIIASCRDEIEEYRFMMAPLKTAIQEIEAERERALGEHKQRVAVLNARLNSLQTRRQASRAERDRNADRLADANRERETLRREIENVPNLGAVNARLEVCGEKAASIRSDQQKMTDQVNELVAERQARVDTLLAEIAEIDARINANGQQDVDSLRASLRVVNTAIRDDTSSVAKLEERVRTLESRLSEHKQVVDDLAAVQTKIEAVRTAIADWTYVQKACGKDGLRALEIDAVAPTIASHANEMLSRTFGPNIAVRFETQDQDTGKEVLRILTIRENGDEVPVDELSGGEKVWVLKALRLAQTLISKEKSGRNFQTALSDEEDGALDEENAMNFIRMHRAFMDLGGFRTVFFISHKPPVIEMANHILSFNGNGVIDTQ